MRAALYARFSSDNQNPTSIEDQLADCRAHAVRQGWTICREYADHALSATSMDRPEFQRMIADAAAGRIDVILTESLSRLSRNMADTEGLRAEMEYHGVRLHTLDRGHVTDMHTAFDGLKNAQQLKDLGNALRRQHRGAVDRGLAPAGLSYGYDIVKELDPRGEIQRGRRRIKEAEAAVIRRIFAEYIAGVSPYEIVRRLNADGIPAPGARVGRGDGRWTVTGVIGNKARGVGILHNRLYIGELVYNRTRKVRHPKTRKRLIKNNPPSEWKVKAVPDLRIIDDDTWAKAHALKARNGGLALRRDNRRPQYLFSGLLSCACCNGSFIMRDARRLGCATHRMKQACDNARTIPREKVEARVLNRLRALLAHPKAIAAYVKEYHEAMRAAQTRAAAQARATEKKLQNNRQKIARLVAAIEEAPESKALAGRLAQLEEETAALEADQAAADTPVIQLYPNAHEVYARKMEELQKALNADTVERAQAIDLLRRLVDRILLRPDDAEPNGLAIEVEGKLQRFLEMANQHRNVGGTSGGPGVDSYGAQGRNRTSDTGIFSPLLYQLSYLGGEVRPLGEGRFILEKAAGVQPPVLPLRT